MNESIPAPAKLLRSGPADVTIIAVTYNSCEYLSDFLHALPAALAEVPSAQVLIVDNASSDNTVPLLRKLAPWAVILEPGVNLGYAGAINLALRQVSAQRGIYVLNPDAVPSAGSVRHLLDAVEKDPSVGLAVPRILDREGALKFSLRREPTLLRAVGEALLGGHRASKVPALGDMIRDPRHYVDGAHADWATGAAMFLSRSALDAVGAWDDSFFLYSEETEYALRLRDRGFRLRYVSRAAVVHPGGEMSRSPWLWSMVAVNRIHLYRKRHTAFLGSLYWGVVVVNEAARSVLGRETHRAALRSLLCPQHRFGRNPAAPPPQPRSAEMALPVI